MTATLAGDDLCDRLARIERDWPKSSRHFYREQREALMEAERDLRYLQSQLTAALARAEAAEKDAARLRFLAVGKDESNPGPELCDDLAGIDLHEQAYIYADALGREEANAEDYVAAFRDACDEAINEPNKGDTK
jgi:hypothetical protein